MTAAPPPPPEPPARIGLALVLFAVAAVVAVNLGALASPQAVLPFGRLADPDAYLRLIRVLELREGGGWFADVTPALSAPEGLSVHWTRPLDLLILLPALALERLAGFDPRQALFVAGIFVSPVLHLCAAIAAAWAARGLWPGKAPWHAVLLMVATPTATLYCTAGRADHHALMLLMLALGLGAAIRALLPGGATRAALGAGLAFGAGIWVSPEVMLGAMPVLVAAGLAAMILPDGRAVAGQGGRMAVAMAGALAVAIVVERPPAGWAAVEYDRVSVQHLVLALLVAAVFAVAARVAALPRGRRLAASGVAAALGLAVLVALFPGAFAASIGQADEASRTLLLPAVQEMQALPPFGPGGLGEMFSTIGGPPFAALIALALAMPGWVRDGRWPAGLALAAAVMAAFVAAFAVRRFTLDLAVPAAVAGAGLVGLVLHGAWPRAEALRGVLAALLLFGLLGLPFAGRFALPPAGPAPLPEQTARAGGCDGTALARWLAQERPGVRPGAPPPILMAADIFLGPEIAWRAPYRSIAGPYHRGGAAIEDTLRVFGALEDAAARDVLRRRGVDFLLLCASAPELSLPAGSLGVRIRDGAVPAWLRPVPLPEALGGYRLLAVVR